MDFKQSEKFVLKDQRRGFGTNNELDTSTGNLTIDSTNVVRRNLRKARFVEGKPLLTN